LVEAIATTFTWASGKTHRHNVDERLGCSIRKIQGQKKKKYTKTGTMSTIISEREVGSEEKKLNKR
jgi:hypothetical protein